ncbi:hypothetical protein GQ472_06025 [archaeon]|nr:hypothetical protein [archaeon]
MIQIQFNPSVYDKTLTVTVFNYIKECLYHTDFVFYTGTEDAAENNNPEQIVCIIKEKRREKMALPCFKNLFALDLLWDISFDADNNRKRLLYDFACEKYGCDICIDSATSYELDEWYEELKNLPFHKPETEVVGSLEDYDDRQKAYAPEVITVGKSKIRPAPTVFD